MHLDHPRLRAVRLHEVKQRAVPRAVKQPSPPLGHTLWEGSDGARHRGGKTGDTVGGKWGRKTFTASELFLGRSAKCRVGASIWAVLINAYNVQLLWLLCAVANCLNGPLFVHAP